MIERELIEEIRLSNDITAVVSEYVRLKRSGSGMVGLCPFHNEKTPSFHVVEDKQIFHCFGCGASGNVITFVMRIENYEFLDAIKFLADRANIQIENKSNTEEAKRLAKKKALLQEIHKKAARFYYDCLQGASGAAADEYLTRRGLSKATRIKCGLGYSPPGSRLYDFLQAEGYDDAALVESGLISPSKKGGFYDRFFSRVMFPIFDITGKVVGFGGRTLGDSDIKYLNSPETPIFEKGKLLYGLNFARHARKRELIVVEGYMDAIALYQNGFMNAVAALGTAFTPYHAKLLKNYADSVILLYDSDEAGVKAVYKAFPLLVKAGLNVKVAQTHDAKDPDEFLKKFGKKQFAELLNNAKSYIAFQIDNERKKYDLANNLEHKVLFTKTVAKILGDVKSTIEVDAYIKQTAEITGISEQAIREEVHPSETSPETPRYRPPRSRYQKPTTAELPKKVIEAQRRCLGLLAESNLAYLASAEALDATDFTNDTYQQLYRIIGDFHAQHKLLRPGEAAAYFEALPAQEEVTDILSKYKVSGKFGGFDDLRENERELNDQIRTIKAYGIDQKIELAAANNDVEALTKAGEERKKIQFLHISLTDG